jgi:hypothetical protein
MLITPNDTYKGTLADVVERVQPVEFVGKAGD